MSVLDAGTADFKASAKRYLDRADAVVLTGGELAQAVWNGVSLKLVAGTRRFDAAPPGYCGEDLVEFVRSRLAGSRPGQRSHKVSADSLREGEQEL